MADYDPRAGLISLLPELRAYARFLTRGRAEADDLVQDAITNALGALEHFDPHSNLRAWVFTILRNRFYEQARRRRSESAAVVQAVSQRGPGAPDQHDRLNLSDLERQLYRLPPLLREALMLVGAHGLAYEEAAQICGVPVGTLKARVSRARAQLALAMRNAEVADPDTRPLT